MKIKTMMRYHLQKRTKQNKKLTVPCADENKEQLKFSYIFNGIIQWYSPSSKQFGTSI